jgi:hypothetical protein
MSKKKLKHAKLPDEIVGRKKIVIGQRRMRQIARQYGSIRDCADYFCVSHDTIERRIKEWGYDSFASFRDSNLVVRRLSLKKHLLARAYKSDKVLIFLLKNLAPEDFSERIIYSKHEQPLAITNTIISFEEFCKKAGYPVPYPKQLEMMEFGINGEDARLLLGSRGYGKTDYVTILGIAYDIYLDYMKGTLQLSWLIVTKSDDRNGTIIREIAKILVINGVVLDIDNSEAIRVRGLHGKDDSISSTTLKSGSKRGRHPKKIIMDDPVTEDDVQESARRVAKRTYDELYKICPHICIIGQPVHKADLYESLRPLVKKMEVPHGTIPELDHDLEAQKLAGVSEESISCSYHLVVKAENPSPFEKVQYIDAFPPGESVAFIDPSFKGIDYTAMSTCRGYFSGIAVKGKVWKKSWDTCLDDIVKEVKENNIKRLAFEVNSLGDMPITILRGRLPNVGIVAITSSGHKHSRIMAAGIFADSIYLCKTSDRIYIDQVIQYEYNAQHDDAPDSLASLMTWIGLVKGK